MADDRVPLVVEWADRPIQSTAEDILGRSPFAKSLASAITGWHTPESLVVALYGPWGSGKTSLKNMILEEVGTATTPPIVVEFNPWQWSTQQRVLSAFFTTIAERLGRKDEAEDAKKAAAKLRVYAAGLRLAAEFPSFVRPVLFAIAAGFVVVGQSGLLLHYESAVRWACSIAALIFAVLGAFGALARRLAALFKARSAEARKSLEERRTELVEALGDLKRPLLIVVDDIDRLTPPQIRQMVQLVKASADLPHVTYLLLFQRDVVERALSDPRAEGSGAEYLAKIIQIGYDLPQIEPARLDRALTSGLDQLLDFPEALRLFKAERWQAIYPDGIRPYFKTVRDVRRFLPVLQFHLGLLGNRRDLEVNPIDLIALETLRVFDPSVYRQLFGLKALLTNPTDQTKVQAGEAVRRLADSARNKTASRSILAALFPQVATALDRSVGSVDSSEWFRDRRVAHNDVFDRYFHLTLPDGDISSAELETVVSAPDRASITAGLKAFASRGVLDDALNRLDHYKLEIPPENAEQFITALFDLGETIPDTPRFWDGFMSAAGHARRVVYWLLRRVPDPSDRGALLRRAIESSEGLFLPLWFLSSYDKEVEGDDTSTSLKLREEDLAPLRSSLLARTRKWASSGRLGQSPGMHVILSRWRTWGAPEEPREWASHLLTTVGGALLFLRGVAGRSYSGKGLRYFFELKDLTLYSPFESVEAALRDANKALWTEDDKLLVAAFRKAVARRRRGLPDDPLHLDSDQ